MDENLNQDGLPAGQPVTFEQIQQANRQRMAAPDSDSFRIFTQQAQRKQRRRKLEDGEGE